MPDFEAWFAAYVAAFNRRDVAAVAALWAFPATIVARGRSVCFDETAFRANTEKLCAFYDRQGVAEAHKAVLRAEELFLGLWLVRTADRMTDSEGAEIARWEHAYLLAESEAGLQAMVALADGEVAAWEARGTPPGSG
jgi:hypothetical protein